MHIRCMFIVLSADRFALGFTHDAFNFSCHMFMHLSCIRSFLYTERAFTFCSFSLSLLDRLCHGIQTAQIYSSSESSWFRVIFFFYSSHTLLYSIPWCEGLDGLLWELPGPWRWNSRSFCWISPTLRYLMSFELGDGNLYVRDSCIVPYKSSTPTYTALIPLCLNSLCNLEVHV